MNKSLKSISDWLGIEFNLVSHLEKVISAVGGFIGIWLVIEISQFWVGDEVPLIVASMGASAVLLFAVPHGSLSQPWPLLGGHLVSAFIGITCLKLVPHLFLAAALAVSLAIAAMYYLRCIHPPGGATALTAVVGGNAIESLGYQYVITPVLLNAIIILVIAIVINYFFSWRRYPASLMRLQQEQKNSLSNQLELSPRDLGYALQQIDSFIDVTEYDLTKIYALATQHHAITMRLQPAQIKLNHYYSNGQYGSHWSIRQIVAESSPDNPTTDTVVYKVITGKERRHTASCTRAEFANWAKYEVYRDENSWKIVE